MRIAQVLVGSRAKEVTSWGLDRIPTYGKLGDWTVEQAKELLHLLADAGLVERQTLEGGKPGAFVLSLSEEGRRVMKGLTRPDLPLPPRTPGRAAFRAGSGAQRLSRATGRKPRKGWKSLGGGPTGASTAAGAPDADPRLLARLKAWRTEESRRRGVPAFVIFHDSTLADLAAARPQEYETLLRIKGLGPAKLAAYGDALLEILRTQSRP